MGEFDFQFELPDPRLRILAGLSEIGINTEVLSGLKPDDARQLVHATGVTWNKILRAGEGGEGSISAHSAYLDIPPIADINFRVTAFEQLSNAAIQQTLAQAPRLFSETIEQYKTTAAGAQRQQKETNGQRIEEILFPDHSISNYSGSLLLSHSSPQGRHTYLTLDKGVVKHRGAHSIIERRAVYEGVTDDEKRALLNLRDDIDSEPLRLHIKNVRGKHIVDHVVVGQDEEPDSPHIGTAQPALNEGWYVLKNAVSRKDPNKQRLGVVSYSLDGQEIVENSIAKSRLLGGMNVGVIASLYEDPQKQLKVPEHIADLDPMSASLFIPLDYGELSGYLTKYNLTTSKEALDGPLFDLLFAKPRGKKAETVQYFMGGMILFMS